MNLIHGPILVYIYIYIAYITDNPPFNLIKSVKVPSVVNWYRKGSEIPKAEKQILGEEKSQTHIVKKEKKKKVKGSQQTLPFDELWLVYMYKLAEAGGGGGIFRGGDGFV